MVYKSTDTIYNMNINDLSPELLLNIISYIPQRELIDLSTVCSVWDRLCQSPSLWKCVNFDDTYEETTEPFKHFRNIQSFANRLEIQSSFLNEMLLSTEMINCENVKTFHVIDPYRIEKIGSRYPSDRAVDEKLVKDIVSRFPDVVDLNLSFSSQFVLTEPIVEVLSQLQLETMTLRIPARIPDKKDGSVLINLLSKQPQLKKLVLECHSSASLNRQTFGKILNGFPNLSSIDLSEAYFDIPHECFSVSTPLNLQEFCVDSANFSDEDLYHLSKRARGLRKLQVNGCRYLTDESLYHLANHCPLLEDLNIDCVLMISPRISDVGLKSLADGCPQLRFLSCIIDTNITDEGVVYLAAHSKNLTVLNLYSCEITDDALVTLGQQCSSLNQAEFYSCQLITTVGVVYLLWSCRRLLDLNLDSCDGIKDFDVDFNIWNKKSRLESRTGNEASNSRYNLKSADSHHGYKKNITVDCEFAASLKLVMEKISTVSFSDNNDESPKNKSELDSKHSHLWSLSIVHCRNISRNNVLLLTKLCPDIRKLNLSGCIPDYKRGQFVQAVFQNCSFCDEFEIWEEVVNRIDYDN